MCELIDCLLFMCTRNRQAQLFCAIFSIQVSNLAILVITLDRGS